MRRPLLTTILAATLASLLATPAAAATTARGTAASTSVPLYVDALDLPVEIGRVSLMASTDDERIDGAPWSSVGLTLLDIDGTALGEVSARSDGETTSNGLSLSRATDWGSVGATVADVLAVADDVEDTATSSLETLSTRATLLQSLGLDVTVSDVTTSVDDTAAAATHTLTLAGVELDLAAMFGAELLGRLPLDDLLALADELGITVPANIGDAAEIVDATDDFLAEVAAVVAASETVETRSDELVAAFGSMPTEITDAIAAIGDFDLLTDDLTTVLGSFTGEAEACNTAPALPITQEDLDAILVCLHDVAIGDEFTALEDAVTAYLGAVASAAAAADAFDPSTLDDIVDGVLDLVAQIAATDLVGVSETQVTQQVRAVGGSLAASSASHTCNVTTVTLIGADPVEVADCDGDNGTITGLLDTVDAAIRPALEAIGAVDAEQLQLRLFDLVEESVTEDGDGWVRATSTLEVLRLVVPDVTITPCDVETVGPVVCALGTDLLAPLEDAVTQLEDAQATVTTAVTDAGGALSALAENIDTNAGTDAATATDAVVDAIAAALAGLPLGELGTVGAVTVPGATVVVDPDLEAEHQVVTTTAGSPDPAPAPAPDPDDPTLPNTGGGAVLLAALALGTGLALRRRREDG